MISHLLGLVSLLCCISFGTLKEVGVGPSDYQDYQDIQDKLLIEKDIIFEEGGRKFKQHESYDSEKKEALITVPAHGDFKATKYIMEGRSSESKIAGKMVVSSESDCSLEDIPAEIIPEDFENQDTEQSEEVKIYQIRSDIRKATEEELENLSENMKTECAGKTVMVSSVKTYNETEFLANSFATKFSTDTNNNNVDNFRKAKRWAGRDDCKELYHGCAVTSPSNCVRWNYGGKTYHVLNGGRDWCISCCPHARSSYLQCSCITNQQRFSTAYAISQALDPEFGNGRQWYDCIKKSNYCKWDTATTIPECKSRPIGACIDDGTCPMKNCATQEECNQMLGSDRDTPIIDDTMLG